MKPILFICSFLLVISCSAQAPNYRVVVIDSEFRLSKIDGYDRVWFDYYLGDYAVYDSIADLLVSYTASASMPFSIFKIENDTLNLLVNAKQRLVINNHDGYKGGDFVRRKTVSCDDHLYHFQNDSLISKDKEDSRSLAYGVNLHYEETKAVGKTGLELINDSLINVLNYNDDISDPFAMPLRSVQYPDEDSLIIDPVSGSVMTVYGTNERYQSGVFNLKNKNWFIQPIQRNCNSNSKGILTESNIYALSVSKSEYLENYWFTNFQNQVVFKNRSWESFTTEELMSYFLGIEDVDTIYAAPHLMWFGDREIKVNYYYLAGKEGVQLYIPKLYNYRTSYSPITPPKEFVHYNPQYEYLIWIENDTIYCEYEGNFFKQRLVDGKIKLNMYYHPGRDIVEFDIIQSNSFDGFGTSNKRYYTSKNEETGTTVFEIKCMGRT